MSKVGSLLVVTGAYAVAVAVAAAWLACGPGTGRLWLDTLIADVLATLVVFAFSRAYRNSSFYDAYWSVIPPLLLFYWWSQAGTGVDQLRCWLGSSSRTWSPSTSSPPRRCSSAWCPSTWPSPDPGTA
jgi:hypothetical protein